MSRIRTNKPVKYLRILAKDTMVEVDKLSCDPVWEGIWDTMLRTALKIKRSGTDHAVAQHFECLECIMQEVGISDDVSSAR